LATGLERAEDPALEDTALFFACAVTLGTRGLASGAGLRRLLPLTVLGFFARAALACFFAFPFETFFFRAAMDRLRMVKETRNANERSSPRQARRSNNPCVAPHGNLVPVSASQRPCSSFDLKMRTG
jgi:hypothetical protein